jgi:LisH
MLQPRYTHLNQDQVRIDTRKRNLLVLILDHLATSGYGRAVDTLQKESGISLKNVLEA